MAQFDMKLAQLWRSFDVKLAQLWRSFKYNVIEASMV